MSAPLNSKWFVILNPHAGARRGEKDKEKILNLLKRYNFDFEYAESNYRGHTIELTRNAVSSGQKQFIIIGGDGSLNEALNGIMSVKKEGVNDVCIAMIPVGTGNDWIRTFDIPNDYKKSVEVIRQANLVHQDVGMVTWGSNGTTEKRFFANMAGFGFDAVVADKVNSMKDKGWSGKWLYLWSLAFSYLKYKTCMMRFEVDGQRFNETIFTVSIGIGKFNGGGMMQAPDAVPDNGEFTMTMIRKIGIWGILKNLRGLYNGSFLKDPHVLTTSGREVRIESRCLIPGEVDGEQLGKSNFSIALIPKGISVYCGSDKYLKQKLKTH
ncbi:diacylglycerol/lipid kinase family protein [Saccharicrinis sp. FJH54]|uniref:diacylglycerol/lipid kinase family protein n=1 Tax=Saccharicrinis sp. FJH54 TaxID=3344665 RepID=UPI0035D47FF5